MFTKIIMSSDLEEKLRPIPPKGANYSFEYSAQNTLQIVIKCCQCSLDSLDMFAVSFIDKEHFPQKLSEFDIKEVIIDLSYLDIPDVDDYRLSSLVYVAGALKEKGITTRLGDITKYPYLRDTLVSCYYQYKSWDIESLIKNWPAPEDKQ